MSLQVVYSLLLVTPRAPLFHNTDGVGVLQGIQTVAGPDVAVEVFVLCEADFTS